MHLLRYFYLSYPGRTLAVCFAITIASLITAATLMAMPVLLISMVGKETAKVQMFFQFFEGIGITPTTENMVTFLLVGITIQSIIFGVTRVYAGFTVAKIVKDLRIRLLTSVSKTEWKFFTNRSSGAYTAALVSEAERSGQGYRTIVDIGLHYRADVCLSYGCLSDLMGSCHHSDRNQSPAGITVQPFS